MQGERIKGVKIWSQGDQLEHKKLKWPGQG